MYTAFAAVYDRLMRDVDYDGWAQYYAALLRKCGVAGGSVCECACGTGSLTVRLQRLGYGMTGVDLSAEMLSVAARKARDCGLTIPFVKQDMCALTLHKRQHAILATCDGVNYLTAPERARRFFRAAYAALRPGGALIFDVSTHDKLQNTLGGNTLGSQEEEIAYIARHSGDVYPGVREMLAALSECFPLFLVSNCQQGYIPCFLGCTGFAPFFRDTACEGTTGLGKAENIALLCRQYGLKRPVYVGDTVSDERSARQAGCAFVHAAYGFGTAEAPDAVIRQPMELVGLLKRGETAYV